MSKAKWLVIFILALAVAVPSYAVELSLGGFPSFMRVRARSIQNGTFINALSRSEARTLGLESNDDEITIIDTTLRLTPQLILSDTITIRAQVDVMRNNLWGGLTSNGFGASGGNGAVGGALTADDSFRGSILLGDSAVDTGQEEQNFFNVRMLHADIVLPNGLGFIRVGRQPFDWGLGMWANGGWDPHSDLGFLPERFLWLKSWPVGSWTFTQVIVSDLVASGNSLVNGSGKAFDIIAGATIFNGDIGGVNTTIGGFYFPWFQQDGIGISSAVGEPVPGVVTAPGPVVPGTSVADRVFDVSRIGLYSIYLDLKAERWRFAFEADAQEGTIDNFLGTGGPSVDIDWQFEMVGRFEFYPSAHAVPIIALEGGFSQGQDNSSSGVNGNLIPMHPAYNIDNLLFKHIIPTIYNQESSAQNAYYGKLSTTIKFADDWTFAPMVLAAWTHETNTSIGNPTAGGAGLPGVPVNVSDDFLGVEVEGTLTWHMYPGVDIDLIGSVMFAGDGLTDLIEAQADAIAGVAPGSHSGDASSTPWAVQGRMIIYIDDFFKGE